MASTFSRKRYSLSLSTYGASQDLVSRINASTERLVLSRVRVVNISEVAVNFFIYIIPPTPVDESDATALVHNLQIYPKQLYDEPSIVLNLGEGLAVAINGTTPGAVVNFHAFGELESIA